MKKLLCTLSALFILALVLSLSGCGGKDDASQAASPSPSASPAAAARSTPSPKAGPTPKAKATPAPKATAAPEVSSSEEEPAPTPEPVEDETDEPADDPYEGGEVWIQPSGNDTTDQEPGGTTAGPDPRDYIDSNIGDFTEIFGLPNSSEYGPSCIGPGEDGWLYYDGFTVKTYRNNGIETVKGVN